MRKKQIFKVRVPDEVAGSIRRLHPHLKQKVRFALEAIMADPYSGKALKDELAGLKSFRVSRFRIIYHINAKKEVEIVTVGPRRIIYEETLRWLKQEK